MTLTDAGARVLRALRDGAELAMHTRQTGRGPYYTLAGRRLGVVTLKELEGQGFLIREGGPERSRSLYTLTEAGERALAAWEEARPVSLP